ncbi:MAG: DUF2911 domain-containing protein [Gemmatimonadota bacterium]
MNTPRFSAFFASSPVRRAAGLCALFTAVFLTVPRAGQAQAPDSAAFVTRLGVDGGVLMINRRTDINGQQYDETADLGRVPMTHTRTDEVTEIFTIRVRETPTGGVLELVWDQDLFSIPFQVR